MSKQNLKHSYRHFTDLQLSTQDFYQKIEDVITSFQYPDVTIKRKFLNTDGVFSHRREYLVIKYRQYRYYVCAAPFGKSYFISWRFEHGRSWLFDWLSQNPLLHAILTNNELSYYWRDTQLMFENSINGIIMECTATVAPDHGRRITAPLSIQQLS